MARQTPLVGTSNRVSSPHIRWGHTAAGAGAGGGRAAAGAAAEQASGAALAQIRSVLLTKKQATALLVLPGIPPAASRNTCESSDGNATALGSRRFSRT